MSEFAGDVLAAGLCSRGHSVSRVEDTTVITLMNGDRHRVCRRCETEMVDLQAQVMQRGPTRRREDAIERAAAVAEDLEVAREKERRRLMAMPPQRRAEELRRKYGDWPVSQIATMTGLSRDDIRWILGH